MNLKLDHKSKNCFGSITITGSKSESNRLLILKALYPDLEISNLSNSDDTQVTLKALKNNESIVDIHHAGTAMRFLTAFFSVKPNSKVVLTGSSRMQDRPIELLVEALRSLGAEIEYVNKKGFPPLKITGKKIDISQVALPANISSQYISALMLIAPSLKNGLEIDLIGETTSIPYIKMTQTLLDNLGFKTFFNNNKIKISPAEKITLNQWTVESDWSSASYFYSVVAIANKSEITLESYYSESLQGDSDLVQIYKKIGVTTVFNNGSITLSKTPNFVLPEVLDLDLRNTPDLAQTIAVSCFGLGVDCNLTGLHTLKIKETDRLEALKVELEKLGAIISITNDSLELRFSGVINQNISIDTYNDHRMAMAFAPLGIKVPIVINNSEVVSKSYPGFWEDFKSIDFQYDMN
ncbi:3-phosphoshikimate 1-carboxyvinyltransferase [Flavobacteriaceae bacterium]|jgi:3-phosphoshikimate 1-carboxyvinyltransferase|nr:3-phosphoshikimate 1-carboxyvinyltransferase [Flavobacteriaceae bacterium]MDA9035854.1 3-phosphoshikimate 1-carboxyvinyltransferase [Flavobacteriaceae bacterium]MDA9139543.1 3-phosphoshikimate 1-carboxyvinyltransferase [Flavobacteriaceae bacterium]MDA9250401.1 3-phosphoshikimate 1-carboxyvinyltransferase [Flavobacteriaceae bacterium]